MFEFLRRSSPLWAHASFNRLWAAQALSAFGNRITRTALPIIAVAVLAATPGEAAFLAAVSLAPMILAGLLGGGFVERSNKLRLMVVMDLVRFAVVIVAPIAWYFDVLSFPLLCGMAAVSGLASALFANADISILPRLVGKGELVEANSRLQATESIAELTGPGVAGVLIDLLTAPIAMIADALTFLWSAFWLWRIPKEAGRPAESVEPAARAAPLSNLWKDLTVGFRAVVHRPPLRAILMAVGFYFIAAGFFAALFMIFMLRELKLSAAIVGAIISVGGASALLGSLTARPLAKRIGFGPALVSGFTLSVAGVLLLIPAAYLQGWAAVPFMIGQQLLGDAGIMVFMILSTSLQQKLLPEDEIARANGLNQAVSGFGMMASILLAGALAEAIGIRYAMMIGAGVSLLGILPLLTRHLLAMRDEPQATAPLASAEAMIAG
ncbi:MAG: MFS transporter [Hyphomonadaceae bacterium]|nr:MFS transporter [Hyphomonadaceae bacterium]